MRTRLHRLVAFTAFSVGGICYVACVGDDPDPVADAASQPDAATSSSGSTGTSGGGTSGSPEVRDATSTEDAPTADLDSGPKDAGSFRPSDLPGLTLWLDSLQGLGVNPSVQNWVDQVTLSAAKGDGTYGNGNNCVPPSRVDGEIKGHPVVRFNGTSNCIAMGDAFFNRFADFREGVSIFIVAKPAGTEAGEQAVLDFSPGAVSTEWVALSRDGDRPRYSIQNPMYGLSNSSSAASAFISGEPHVLSTVVQAGDEGAFSADHPGGKPVAFFIDGTPGAVASAPAVYVPTVKNRQLSTLGRYVSGHGIPNGNSPGWFKGDIGEVIVYFRALAPGELAQVHAYLKAKWL